MTLYYYNIMQVNNGARLDIQNNQVRDKCPLFVIHTLMVRTEQCWIGVVIRCFIKNSPLGNSVMIF